MEDVLEYWIKELIKRFQECGDEIAAPGTACRRGALKDVFIGFFRGMTRWAAIIIAGFSVIKSFSSWKVKETEFSDTVLSLFKFWIHAAEGLPIHSMESTLIPV
jgi:hypothetical protein